MNKRALGIALLALLTFTHLHAAELTLELGNGSQRLSSAQLLAHPQAQNVEISDDVSYKRSMRYRAVPLAALLDGVKPGDHLQLVASDGFAAELSAAPALSQTGSQAWLAIEDPAQPWPALGNGKPSAGPFYLVWQNPAASQIDGIRRAVIGALKAAGAGPEHVGEHFALWILQHFCCPKFDMMGHGHKERNFVHKHDVTSQDDIFIVIHYAGWDVN